MPTKQGHKLYPYMCETIRQARKALGLSLEEFATRIGKPEIYVIKLERAELPYDYQVLCDCAYALDLALSELVELTLYDEFVVVEEEEPGARESAPPRIRYKTAV